MTTLKLFVAATFSVLGLSAGVALADKDFTEAGDATYDCAADPVVNIAASAGTFTLTGECKEVNVNGSKLVITAADVGEININGASNKITLGVVAQIAVNGAKNKVTWKKAKTGKKPTVSTTGVGNSVAKGK